MKTKNQKKEAINKHKQNEEEKVIIKTKELQKEAITKDKAWKTMQINKMVIQILKSVDTEKKKHTSETK